MAVIKIVPMPGAVGDKGDEGAPGPQGQQGPAGQNGLPGTPALWSYQGAWQANAAYAIGDLVTYQGQLYYAKAITTAGTLPTDTSKFDLIASKGADGTNGTNGADGADANTGDITFDGVQIIGAGTESGDGSNLGTIELVPDGNITSDQYVIIDPTSPNHIHIRAGGEQDNSSAQIYLGGERNNIEVSDPYRTVKISTKPDGTENTYGNSNEASNTQFIHASGPDIIVGDTVRLYTGGPTYVVTAVTQDSPAAGFMTVVANGLSFISGEAYLFTRDQGYNNQWTFGNDGVLSGPAMGGIWVESIQKKSVESGLGIYSPVDIVLEASNGEFLNDSSNPANQIATIGNINDTVSTGMVRYSPTFTATGLAFTGSGVTHPTYNSYYVKAGNMVTFAIEVDCATVTNFGTGQFKLQLPFTPAVGFNHFSGWAQVDTAVNPDVPNGHVILNVDHAGITDVLDLHYLKQAGGAHTPIIEGLFLQNTPVELTTSSKIYVNGTYISDLMP